VQTDFFRHITELQGECVYLPGPQNLQLFGGVILKQSLWGRLSVFLSLLQYNFKVYQFLRRRRVDFIQCHSLRALLTVGLAAKLADKPIMWWIKSHLGNPFLDRLGFRLADRIVFQNQINRDRLYPRLVRRYAGKIKILQEGINLEEIDQADKNVTQAFKQELNWRPDRLNLIMLAHLTPRKGAHVLLEAMVRVQKAIPQVALYFVGDDASEMYRDYHAELKEFISRHHLRDIYFTGWRRDRLSILALMDILVHPSSDEGVPGAILESMAMGKPVIATRVGGIPGLIHDGENGILLEWGDAQGLAQAIITLAQDPGLRRRLGARGREVARKDYSNETQLANLQAIYGELTAS
jgi:glycosyltransferase involved in cell wall biosynthesis